MKRKKVKTKRERKYDRERLYKTIYVMNHGLKLMLAAPDGFRVEDIFVPYGAPGSFVERMSVSRTWQRNLMIVLLAMGVLAFNDADGGKGFVVKDPGPVQTVIDAVEIGDFKMAQALLHAALNPQPLQEPKPGEDQRILVKVPVFDGSQAHMETRAIEPLPDHVAGQAPDDGPVSEPNSDLPESDDPGPRLIGERLAAEPVLEGPSPSIPPGAEPAGPPAAHDHPSLTDAERARVVLAEDALVRLASPGPHKRIELFPEEGPSDSSSNDWQHAFLRKLHGSDVIVRHGERNRTRYEGVAERVRALLADPEWLLRLVAPLALVRQLEAAGEPPGDAGTAVPSAAPSVGDDLLSEIQRLLPEFYKILAWQHDRIAALESVASDVNAKLDAVLALLKDRS